MKQESKEPAPLAAMEFAKMIGQRETYSMLAGRCTAADADCLKKTRDRKLYLGFAKNWDECCTRHFALSRANAERLIGLLEEFGAAYFEIAQLTRISPETFRTLAPSIQDKTLHHNGAAIALIPKNAARVAQIVGEHRKAAAPPRTTDTRLAALEQRSNRLIAEFEQLSGAWRDGEERMMLGAVLARTCSALTRLGLELGA